MSNRRLWLLPSRPDVESQFIARLLAECGEETMEGTLWPTREDLRGRAVIAIEREDLDTLPSTLLVIDHHSPGDPGYGVPPAEFLRGSSIGQMISLLGDLDVWPASCSEPDHHGLTSVRPEWQGTPDEDPHGSGGWWLVGTDDYGHRHRLPYAQIPRDYVYAAAADHCLGAAYRGECPGVDPEALMHWRLEQRAAHQGRPVEEILTDVERAREALRSAPRIALLSVADMPHTQDHDWSRSVCDGCARDEVYVADMRAAHYPELPEAAAREGVAFIAIGLPTSDGRRKIVLQSASPEQLAAWPEWAEREGLVDLYGGDPERGFAGGYLS